MKLVDGLFGIGEDALVPGKGTVLGVPAGRTKSGAEIDERVARKLFLAKSLGFGNDFFVARQSAMRLLVAERPERRRKWRQRPSKGRGDRNGWSLVQHPEGAKIGTLSGKAEPRLYTQIWPMKALAEYSCRKAEEAWMNSGQRAPMTGPWPELGTIQRREFGMDLNSSTESSNIINRHGGGWLAVLPGKSYLAPRISAKAGIWILRGASLPKRRVFS
jgi:hypothetical protein